MSGPDGECVVLRVLSKGPHDTNLRDLGLGSDQLTQFFRCINRPHGLVLACGPKGSGKSTTLYASLKSIQRPDRKLMTIEDPIEYRLPGIVQVDVSQEKNHPSYSAGLRELLKHDPDVILVGEIRDGETAELSVHAALVGHLVLSTLCSFDAVGIIDRLRDYGLKDRNVASSLTGGVAQRLARRVCPNCAEDVLPSMARMELLARHGQTSAELRHGRGCKECAETGFKGRLGIYEVLEVSETTRELIKAGANELEVARASRAAGMRTLLEDALSKSAAGLIPFDEVERLCMLTLS